ncbi:MAG: DUF5667 domain-containing protein [Patescibacteria group bacterium]|nr:DUF5667 domain-containing protein [Patescibacteria group bacterium]
MKNLENNLKQFRDIEPDEKFWHITKSILLNKIEKDMTSHKHQRFSFDSLFFDFSAFTRTFIPSMKFASVLMSVLVVISGTFIGAKAAMPGTAIGNILYPVKTQLIEPAELAFANSDTQRVKISLDHATTRLQEINYLIDNRKEDQLKKVTDNMEKTLAIASDNLESITHEEENIKTEELVELAKSINKNSDETLTSLRDKVVASNPKAIENIIKSTQKLNTAALEIMIKDNSSQEIVNKSLDNQIKLQIESVRKLGEKISIGEQALIKKNDSLSTTTEQTDLEVDSINPITNINKQEIEFSIDSIKKVADPEQITLLLERARKFLDEGKIEEAYVEIQKADLYINLADSTLDSQNFETKIKELEKAINQAQVKSETELKIQ